MAGLLDIAPASETVLVGGQSVTVTGVTAKGLAHLLARFPELRALMSGEEIGADALIAKAGDAIAPIIAAGCGYPGNEKAEERAALFPLGEQADLLAAIIRLTMPQGVGPFVEKLTALGGALKVDGSVLEATEATPIKLRAVRSQ